MEKLDIAETGFTKNLEELCDDLDKRKDNLVRHLEQWENHIGNLLKISSIIQLSNRAFI